MKFQSKTEFETNCEREWQILWELISSLPKAKLIRRPRRSGSRSIKDDLAHLYGWHRLLLSWKRSGLAGRDPEMPARGFNWRQTPELNEQMFRELKGLELASISRRLKRSHNTIMKWVSKMSDDQFCKPGFATWSGKYPVSSYIAPNTISHYRWAIKRIKRTIRST